ncbi:hypothetical protein SH1V18_31530 [Vallitalea longa]|uniref:DUF6199 domain-containing protein n=1 Tax=Vallitalea longa TaxID=2936439 RepID=A0A9W5YGB6_9FIRM|nr:DUF6199 family natural product biosynthesis protein [Vallitalea longa]GKX30673.1 hypothetical protein SH1V18_31530 [Vallitalea longa]
MKKVIIILGIMLLLTSCSHNVPDTIDFHGHRFYLESVENEEKVYNMRDGAISYGETYNIIINETESGLNIRFGHKNYLIEGEQDNYTVTYPNRVKIKHTNNEDGEVVCGDLGKVSEYPEIGEFKAFLKKGSVDINGSQLFFGFILIIIGIISIVNPEVTFFLNRGWMYKNTEPSELYLTLTKFGGVIICIIGVVLQISSCSS